MRKYGIANYPAVYADIFIQRQISDSARTLSKASFGPLPSAIGEIIVLASSQKHDKIIEYAFVTIIFHDVVAACTHLLLNAVLSGVFMIRVFRTN